MTLLTLLYKFFIGPLELFFEVVYMVTYRLIGDPALAIVILSLAMNFLVLPLYRRADAMQEEQRDLAIAMKPWSDHIKRTFKGDERFMMQQAYNRQMGYKQTDILKSSISLLLEIPFFIAAFHFLSNLELLNGVSLGPIANLGAPDALLSIGSTSINVLPILMTLINVVSAFIYLKGFPLSSKIQTYGIAAIFLVLLYNSPAGLVFYWTLNNLFSLVKNIFYRLSNPKLVLSVLSSISGIVIPALAIVAQIELSPMRIAFLVVLALGPQIPLLSLFRKGKKFHWFTVPDAAQQDSCTFHLGCLFLALLTGVLIPLSVLQASPAEFVNTTYYESPLWLTAEAAALAFGTFIIWFGVFYWIASPKGKIIFNALVFVLAGTAIINYLFFGTDYGNLSSYLQFDSLPSASLASQAINLAVVLLVAVVLLFIWHKKRSVAPIAYAGLSIAIVAVGIAGSVSINTKLAPIKATAAEPAENVEEDLPQIQLSKTGKNVVIIMLDRAVPDFVPFLFHEKSELKELFAGFTVYTNTVSYGTHTNVGNVAIWGGSEYRPIQMNERAELKLEDKQNEALKVMPTLFAQAGYTNTIFDPPLAGYRWIPDLSIYDDMPNTSAYNVQNGLFYDGEAKTEEGRAHIHAERARNFFCYSIFKTSPLALQHILYAHGGYNSTQPIVQVQLSQSVTMGYSLDFMNTYSVITSLPTITAVSENESGNLFIMANETTHSATVLKEPEYIPAEYIDNRSFDTENDIRYTDSGETLQFSRGTPSAIAERTMHYEINMATYLALGEWFTYLRENDIWNNTRIILVSDHSWPYLFDDSLYFAVHDAEDNKDYYRDPLAFTCLLMVKDFDSTKLTFNDQFMTNADVPVLAMKGVIGNPINPFTGNSIDSLYKTEPLQYLLDSDDWETSENSGEAFLPGRWFSVHDDTRNKNNWEYLGFY